MNTTHLRPIVGYLPRYAFSRRLGWTPPGSGPLPDYLLLRRVAIERGDEPVTYTALHKNALNPYSTIDTLLDGLPRLVELGLLNQFGDTYELTTVGRDVLTHGERDANDYTASQIHLLPDDLARLASTLQDVTERQRSAPEPADKAHQHRVPFLRRFDPRRLPPIQLEYAMYALQRSRDDAHIAAWRTAGLEGPEIELLSLIRTTGVTTDSELVELAYARMRPGDVVAFLNRLERTGYVMVGTGKVTISDRGREVRDRIEHETDRIYFAPWPNIDAGWVIGQLETLVVGLALPSHRP